MTTASRSRSVVAVLFGVAGLLVLVAVIAALTLPIDTQWVFLVSALVLAAAWIALGVSGTLHGVGRMAAAAAAIGWLVVAPAGLVPGVLVLVGAVVAALGGLVAGIRMLSAALFGRTAKAVFLGSTAVMAIYLLDHIFGVLPAVVSVILAVLYGAGLVITAVVVLFRPNR